MKYLILPILALVGVVIYSFMPTNADQNREPPGTYPADHIIRITALLEFDGKPVVVDELITCLAEGAGGSTSGRQFLSFQPNRILVAVETPDGGMIMFPALRSLCYAHSSIWSDATDGMIVPKGWTPVLTWYDNRNPREWNEGIMYVSETALTAENGRIRIIDEFEVTIPEYPITENLLAEANAQAIERDFWQGVPPTRSEAWGQRSGDMGTMIEVPESMWRNPDPVYLRTSIHANRDTDPQPLIDFLDGLGDGDKIIAVPYRIDPNAGRDSEKIMPEEALRMMGSFNYGRRVSLGDFFERGVPRTNLERFGLLIGENLAKRYTNIPFDLNRYDTRIPWTCEGNVVTPDFDNPGLVHIFRQRCTHPRNFESLVWPSYGEIPEWNPNFGVLFFDQNSKTFWYFSEL